MSITSAELRKLASLSLSPEQMAGVLELLALRAEREEELERVEQERRAADAARKREERAKKRGLRVHGQSTDSPTDVHRTPSPLVPPLEVSPTPPSKTPPIIPPSNQFSARETPDHVQIVERLLAIGENYLHEWEWDFLISLAAFDRLTGEQRSKLDGIARKLELAERITGPPDVTETGEIIPLHKVKPNVSSHQNSGRARNFAILDAIVAEAERRENEGGGSGG